MDKLKHEIFDWAKTLLAAAVIAFVVRAFLFNPVTVEGSSMMPTLKDEDHVMVTKIGTPKRFDIIVFRVPSKDENYIKRVIGLPGDTIEYKNDVLYINGEKYEEPYLEEFRKGIFDGPLTNSFSLAETPVNRDTVPKGHLFVLGDNRRYSHDSRQLGSIPMDSLIGTGRVVFWPFKDIQFLH